MLALCRPLLRFHIKKQLYLYVDFKHCSAHVAFYVDLAHGSNIQTFSKLYTYCVYYFYVIC